MRIEYEETTLQRILKIHSNMIIESVILDDDEFDDAYREAKRLNLIDKWDDWCEGGVKWFTVKNLSFVIRREGA